MYELGQRPVNANQDGACVERNCKSPLNALRVLLRYVK
jgi:hypothetical protein